MKTNNIIKAFGTMNVTLMTIAVVLTYCVMKPLSEMQVDVRQYEKEILVVCLACVSLLLLSFAFINGIISLIIHYDWHDEIKRNKAIAIADHIYDSLCNPAIDSFQIESGKGLMSVCAYKTDLIARAMHPEKYNDKVEYQTHKIFSHEIRVRYSGDLEKESYTPNMFVVVVRNEKTLYRRCARVEYKKS